MYLEKLTTLKLKFTLTTKSILTVALLVNIEVERDQCMQIIHSFLYKTHSLQSKCSFCSHLFGLYLWLVKPHLIIAIFGTPPHYWGLLKYTKEYVKLRQNSQNRPKFGVFCAKKYSSAGGADKYQLFVEQCATYRSRFFYICLRQSYWACDQGLECDDAMGHGKMF